MANDNQKPGQTKALSLDTPTTASSTEDKEAQLREREKALDERAKRIADQERTLDSKAAAASPGSTALAASTESSGSDTETVTVVNNGRRAIAVPGWGIIPPDGATTLPRRFWRNLFGKDGKPTVGAKEHIDPQNGNRPELQEVSIDNLSNLPDEHAHAAINGSTDATRLGQFAQTESRPTVKDAINARLAALKK